MNLAPNGKKSNLTKEQYRLVRTPAFKKWFGDWENDKSNSSKVVDENGEPLIMYSGSPYKFTIFKTDEIEIDKDDREMKPRFWFIKDKNLAEIYSRKKTGNIENVYEVFLNIKNPKYDFNLYVKDKNDGSIEFIRKKISVVVATFSNQIKLADGTNTTFNVSNPDIRFKDGGNMETEWKVIFESKFRSGNVTEVRVNAKNFNDAKNKGWVKSGLNKKFYAFLTTHEIKVLGGVVGGVYTKTLYFIVLSGGDWSDLYADAYDDYEDALSDFNSVNYSDFGRYENSSGLSKYLSEKTLKYKFVGEIDEDENIDDYTDNRSLKDKTLWKIIEEGDEQTIEVESIERVNKKADELLSEVVNHFGRKYNTIYLDEDETISLKLRIADHSGKWKNKGDDNYFLSIVISDKNPTEGFYKNSAEGLKRSEEEVFSSDNTFEEIIDFVNEKIKDYKEEQYAKGGIIKVFKYSIGGL